MPTAMFMCLPPPRSIRGTCRPAADSLAVAGRVQDPCLSGWLDQAPGQFPPPQKHALMDQKNLAFVPHVLPVVAGTTVDFLNSDAVLHNVFTPDKCAGKFNLGTWPKGEVRSMKFEKTGCSPVLLCNVHPEMEAFVVVLQNPYAGVTDKTGAYTIADVPEGKYTLKAWNRKFLDATGTVTVPKSGEAKCDLVLK